MRSYPKVTKIFKIFFFISSFFYLLGSSIAFGSDYLNVFLMKDGKKLHLYNIKNVYGKELHYYIQSGLEYENYYIYLGDSDKNYVFSLQKIFKEAAKIWNSQLKSYGIDFSIKETSQLDPKAIVVTTSNPKARKFSWGSLKDPLYATTFPAKAAFTDNNLYISGLSGIYFNPRKNKPRISDFSLKTYEDIFSKDFDQEYKIAQLVVLQIAVHELGHALGLGHWGASSEQGKFFYARIQEITPNITPIMTPSIVEYFYGRYVDLGKRRLPLDNGVIKISNNELETIKDCVVNESKEDLNMNISIGKCNIEGIINPDAALIIQPAIDFLLQ